MDSSSDKKIDGEMKESERMADAPGLQEFPTGKDGHAQTSYDFNRLGTDYLGTRQVSAMDNEPAPCNDVDGSCKQSKREKSSKKDGRDSQDKMKTME